MNVGVIGTRLAGTDGVSLESTKLVRILGEMGHAVYLCAGELDPPTPTAILIPELHFAHPQIRRLHDLAFAGDASVDPAAQIERTADRLRRSIESFVRSFSVDVLIVQNALAIPMNLPLGVALADYLTETELPAVAHHHDFYWERARFSVCRVQSILDRCFPPDIPTVRHVVINSLAQTALRERRGLESIVLPNVLDFETGPTARTETAADLRAAVGLGPDDLVVLQPTRVIPRKGIEMAIDLVRRLADRLGSARRCRLLVTHATGDEGVEYERRLRSQAVAVGVDLRFIADRFGERRRVIDGRIARLDLQDAYTLADFVSYPSLCEGFGNAFLEAVFHRKLLFMNRYPVYAADIEPLGFDVVAVDGAVTDRALNAVIDRLLDPSRANQIVDDNYRLASAHFSYSIARRCLERVLSSLSP